jgi:translation initiation factor IF-3
LPPRAPPTTRKKEQIISEPRINDRIRVPEVRLVGPSGEQVGIVKLDVALRLAAEADLDLVEVAPDARPPVAKLMDYGKFKYESAQKARDARRHQANTVLKEIRFRLKIDPHDYGTKKGHVERFLGQGDKVKVMIMFRGREQSRPELGMRLLGRLADDVSELGAVESAPRQDGRNMVMVLSPVKKKAARPPARKRPRDSGPAPLLPTSPELMAEAQAETVEISPEAAVGPSAAPVQSPADPSLSPGPADAPEPTPDGEAPSQVQPGPKPRPSAPRPAPQESRKPTAPRPVSRGGPKPSGGQPSQSERTGSGSRHRQSDSGGGRGVATRSAVRPSEGTAARSSAPAARPGPAPKPGPGSAQAPAKPAPHQPAKPRPAQQRPAQPGRTRSTEESTKES